MNEEEILKSFKCEFLANMSSMIFGGDNGVGGYPRDEENRVYKNTIRNGAYDYDAKLLIYHQLRKWNELHYGDIDLFPEDFTDDDILLFISDDYSEKINV